MDRRSPGRIIAGCFALCGFAVAIFASLGVDATASTILLRAIIAMIGCYIVGAVIGAVSERCVQEGIQRYMIDNPIPEAPTFRADGTRGPRPMPATGERAQGVKS